ncbi:hypothetical protein NC652_032475 [Populus alba x Populus x berolinensis]|nr:hypothetical protein NC652_032475 [Populus alba x Populus x berolinensis]
MHSEMKFLSYILWQSKGSHTSTFLFYIPGY